MIRPVFTEIVLFLAPFVLYAVFLWATQAGVMDFKSWPLMRVATLAIVALALVLGDAGRVGEAGVLVVGGAAARRVARLAARVRGGRIGSAGRSAAAGAAVARRDQAAGA